MIGASSGMGREIARRLIADKWVVGLAARREELLQPMIEKAVKPSACMRIDICEEDAAVKLRQLIEMIGGVDLFFHISGVGKVNARLDETIEMNTVSTNALGFTRMVGEAYRYMAAHGGGHIVALTSIAGVRGLGAAPSYSATKAFQHNYIQALEQQANARRLPIRFTEIRPGFVDTPLLAGSRFPMTMSVDEVVDELMWAVKTGKHQRIIDWKYRILVALWCLVPQFIYRRMRLGIANRIGK